MLHQIRDVTQLYQTNCPTTIDFERIQENLMHTDIGQVLLYHQPMYVDNYFYLKHDRRHDGRHYKKKNKIDEQFI